MNDSAQVVLLTGGSDKPYALGLASALAAGGTKIDFVGSDELNCPEICQLEGLRFLNLRGDQRENAPVAEKALRLLRTTLVSWRTPRERGRLCCTSSGTTGSTLRPTGPMLYYRAMGKRIVFTAHNVNTAARNGNDTWLNRVSLRIQYHLCDHVFVHTAAMKEQLRAAFGLSESRISVVPFGIDDTIAKTGVPRSVARRQLGIAEGDRALLFFGQIAPTKGSSFLSKPCRSWLNAASESRRSLPGRSSVAARDTGCARSA